MSSSFDLSPVIGLHRVLPPTPSSTTDSSGDNSAGYFKPVDLSNLSSIQARQLGDFSALWDFLQTTPARGGVSPPTSSTNPHLPPPLYSTPTATPPAEREESSALRNQNSPKKPRRVVTFAANVGRVDGKTTNGSKSTATTTTTTDDHQVCNGVKAFVKHVSRPLIESKTTPEARKVNIIQKLMGMFPESKTTLLRPPTRTAAGLSPDGVHVFVDNSNVSFTVRSAPSRNLPLISFCFSFQILIGFYDHIKKVRGYGRKDPVRRPAFSFHSLSLILERGRGTAKKVLVGSSPITPVILEARELGYETSILERVEKERSPSSASSGSESATSNRRKVEQAVDEICHLKILESVLDYTPSTIVLASGDGAAGEYSPGFFRVIERCLARGWTVELVAFKQNLSRFYRDKAFKKKWKDQFRFVALDSFAEDLLG